MRRKWGEYGRGSPGHRRASEIHCKKRLYHRYRVMDRFEQGVMLQRHTVLALSGMAELMCVHKDSHLLRLVEDGRAFYPVLLPEFGWLVTYLTERQAHQRSGLEFLL